MRVKLNENAQMPIYMSPGDAGMDLHALTDALLPAEGVMIVKTGVSVEIPEGYYGALVGRSGLAARGILAHYGTVDSLYRGEIGVILFNTNSYMYRVNQGDRIAQLIIQPYSREELEQVEALGETDRGAGFGSSGK